MTEELFAGTDAPAAVGGYRSRGHVHPKRWRWLESTVTLQREAYGFDWTDVGVTTELIAANLKDNLFAALVELGEVSREFSWKSWAHDKPFVHRQKSIEEIVDAAHFLANMLIALDVNDEEWEAAYQAKQAVNRQRQLDGYSARKDPG